MDTGVPRKFDHYTWTGRSRYRPQLIKTGWFSSTTVLVLQYEMTFVRTEYFAGMVDSYTDVKWVDVKPEWIMENATN